MGSLYGVSMIWMKYVAPTIDAVGNLVKTLEDHPRGALYAAALLFVACVSIASVVLICHYFVVRA
jgi:hypothetical protein